MSYYSEARAFHEREQYEEAYKLYEQGANAGDEKCYYGIALFLHSGYCVDEDKAAAAKIFAEHYDGILALAEAGDAEAMFIIACYYSNGFYVNQDNNKQIAWLSKSADAGYANAQWRLGYKYEYGEDIIKDIDKALELYRASADQGDSEAQWRLGDLYIDIGVTQDFKKALELYEKSVLQGNSHAKSCLAYLYHFELGVKKDIDKALELYMQAAEKENDDMALCNIGVIFEDEKNDPVSAKYWYERGTKLGHSFSAFNLGQLYEKGISVDKSINKAIGLYKIACNAEEPCPHATYQLGFLYYNGYGVKRNLKKAKEYFEKAIKQGHHCSYALDMVRSELGEFYNNKMREYADGLLKKNISSNDLYQQISKDLQKDFGETWDITDRDTKKFLETGMLNYVSLYRLGPHIYGNLDFSSSITQLFKALEKELGKYLYTNYIQFLKEQNISPDSFSQKRSFLKRISSTQTLFRDPFDLTEFTLGSLHLTVGIERNSIIQGYNIFRYSIDNQMLEYLTNIFKEDAFGKFEQEVNYCIISKTQKEKSEQEIIDYIVSLTQEIESIADSLRNPAAHDQSMKIQKAEVCGNYIIKVQKLLFGFLSKLK